MAKKDWRENDDAEIRIEGRVSGSLREKVKADLIAGRTKQEIMLEALRLMYEAKTSAKHNY